MGRMGHSPHGWKAVRMGLASILPVLSLSLVGAAPPRSGAPTSQLRDEPRVLVGPLRVKLVGGKTLDGIAVFRDDTRVRVVLDDGTEIVFDPLKVVSVVALADLEAGGAKSPQNRIARPLPPTPEISEKDLRSAAGTTSRKTLEKRAPAGKSAAPSSGPDGPASGGESTSEDVERDENIAQLAAMLEQAILNADIEGRQDPDLGDDGAGAALEAPAPEPGTVKRDPGYTRPKPEDFDATRPVLQPGIRFIGRKGDLPSTAPPLPDFPKPAAPTVSLGPAIWRPASGFGRPVKWPASLGSATSFGNGLSGFGRPTTNLGPSWWNPKPILWPSSIFPETWQPADGFAKSQKSKESTRPPSTGTTGGSGQP